MSTNRIVAWGLLAAGLVVVPAVGQSPAEEAGGAAPDAPDRWVIKFEPTAWYVAPNGTTRLPGDSSAGNGETYDLADLNLDSPRLSPALEVHFQRGDWRLRAMGAWFEADSRGAEADEAGQIGAVSFAAGDTLRSGLEVLTFAADVGYEIHEYRSESGSVPIDSRVFVIGGVRALDVDLTSEVFAGSASIGSASGAATHAHPLVGVRWELEITDQFAIDLTTSVGGLSLGDNESWSSDILVGFQWNPVQNLGVQVGYRQLLMGIEDDEAPSEFAWNGGLAGVYAGATLRF